MAQDKAYGLVTIDQKEFLSMVGELPFSTKQINLLMQKTPAKFIKSRVIPGGGQAEFVETSYVIGILNLVTGYQWDFDVQEEKEVHGQIVIRGKLTIHTQNNKQLTKTQYGRATIKFKKNSKEVIDYGNDCKAAVSDCIKKCASLFGIAWDVFGKEDMREVQIVDQQTAQKNDDDAQAEILSTPLEEVQLDVKRELNKMSTVDRIKKLKDIGVVTTDKLTEVKWRRLYKDLGLEK